MIIGITGGKGGTGKTVIAVNLALAMAGLGKRVTYLDCDTDCPSAHILLGAMLGERRAVQSFLPAFDLEKCRRCGRCVSECQFNALYPGKDGVPTLFPSICSGCKTCVLACPHGAVGCGGKIIGWTFRTEAHGIGLFSGKLKPSEPLSEKMVEAVKARGTSEGSGDIIIIDTSAGTHCPVVRALEGCDIALAVTEPTVFGEHDLRAIIEVLDKLGIPHRTLVNRSTISGKKIPGAAMEIPYDRAMMDCYIAGMPIVRALPNHPISRQLSSFAAEVLG